MIKYENICTAVDMVNYLGDKSRLNNIGNICQYTNLSAVKNIFKSKYWFVNNPKNMNDLYEYKEYKDISDWDKIFFISYLGHTNENMAMWSMYGQPWDEGVMLLIPIEAYYKWIDSIDRVYKANPKTKQMYDNEYIMLNDNNKVSTTRVLYWWDKTHCLLSPTSKNNNFNTYKISEFAGYVKDSAWEYEKEIRMRFDLESNVDYEAIAIKIPEEVLREIIIMRGPRYSKKDVQLSLPEEYRAGITILDSKFREKLKWIPCDTCKIKEMIKNFSHDFASFDNKTAKRELNHIMEKM